MSDTFQSLGSAAEAVVDRWAWWQAALADPKSIGKSLPIHEGDPQQGYYRTKNRAGVYEPVAIFYPDGGGDIVAFRAGREVKADDVWTWACRAPITYDAYERAMAGGGWEDDDPTVAEQVIAYRPGHNSGDVDDVAMLRDQIDSAMQGAGAYKTIADDETLLKAQSLRARLLELSNEAVKKHKREKEPHLEAGRSVDRKWFPLRDDAKTTADQIRDAMGRWETEKLRRQREAEKAAEAAREAARQATAAREAESAEQPALPMMEAAPAPASAPQPIKGTYGKAASVKVKLVVSGVTDWPALSAYMLDHPEVRDLLKRLAQRAVDAGRTVPGITTEEEAKVS